jgi:hypothetical protein
VSQAASRRRAAETSAGKIFVMGAGPVEMLLETKREIALEIEYFSL